MLSNSFRWGTAGWMAVSPDDRFRRYEYHSLDFTKAPGPHLQLPRDTKAWSGPAASGLCHTRRKDGVELHICSVFRADDLTLGVPWPCSLPLGHARGLHVEKKPDLITLHSSNLCPSWSLPFRGAVFSSLSQQCAWLYSSTGTQNRASVQRRIFCRGSYN